ncbi:MAG: dihydroneopterin aldolase family protein [Methanobrevibacter sp.]|nr:dihydroneopterin aldolase family protein [Candidatus Methanoflexus mossambicus]
MDVENKYFSNITSRERAIFEGGISMGALFHQFIGTPVNFKTAKNLEIAISNSIKLQPAVVDVEVSIELNKIMNENTEYDYVSLSGDMLNVKIVSKIQDVEVHIRMRFVEELSYPLMFVEKIIE